MESYINDLRQRMEAEIRAIGPVTASIPYFRKCNVIARRFLASVKAAKQPYSFANQEEEIRYYKDWACHFLCQELYYSGAYQVELERNRLRRDGFRDYLESELSEIDLFFERNRWLYEYHVGGETMSDAVLFTKEGILNEELDATCCTTYSYRLAQVKAFERLRSYLEGELLRIDHPDAPAPSQPGEAAVTAEWRGSKSDAVELIIGIQLSEAIYINDRPASMAQLTEKFERLLSVDLKDFKNLDYANRSRKKDQTPFLRGLIKRSDDRAQRLND